MNGYGRTQLSGAVPICREEIVKMLRERVDFEPNARDEPFNATVPSYLGWVRDYGRLLELVDVNPDAVATCGQTVPNTTLARGCEGTAG